MRLFSGLILILGLGLSPAMQAADQKLVSVEVTLANAEAVTKAATGMRTLFVILHDSASQMPRPYGAVKVDLKADPKGTVYKGDVTTADVKTMGGAPGNIPAEFRLKVRLDKDGSGGPDQAGDIVGIVQSVKAGGTAKVVLDNVIK
ncbi:MAG: hypothetical protein ACOVS5_09620 [Oligoflexus sp.]|jgi:hypothetical protein